MLQCDCFVNYSFQQLVPEDAEEFIDYLIKIGRLDEAASKLAEIVNRVSVSNLIGC